jgi:cytochrome c553
MTARPYVHLCDLVQPDDADARPETVGACRRCGQRPDAGRRSDDFTRLRKLEDEELVRWQRQESE